MLAWSWRRWPELLIDFGRELYVPWRLIEGEVLYRDIAYFNGPLSPYVNALWFRIFGVSLETLAICNVLLIAALAALLYRMIEEVADRLAAAVAGLVFVAAFAFAQIGEIGNYNFVTPYSTRLPTVCCSACWRSTWPPARERTACPGSPPPGSPWVWRS